MSKWQGFGITMRESGISYLRFARVSAGPNAGLDEGVQDLDEKQRPRPDVNGEYGYRLVLDAGGLVKEWVNRGPDGEDKANSHGVLKEIRSHDRFGNVIDARTVDEQAFLHPHGWDQHRLEFNTMMGNPTRMSFFDVKGQPVVAQALGAAGIGFTYDRRGQITSQTFFGPDQKMVVVSLVLDMLELERRRRHSTINGVEASGCSGHDRREPRGDTRSRLPIGMTGRANEGGGDGRHCRNAGPRCGNVSEMRCMNEQGAPTISVSPCCGSPYTFAATSFPRRSVPLRAAGRPWRCHPIQSHSGERVSSPAGRKPAPPMPRRDTALPGSVSMNPRRLPAWAIACRPCEALCDRGRGPLRRVGAAVPEEHSCPRTKL